MITNADFSLLDAIVKSDRHPPLTRRVTALMKEVSVALDYVAGKPIEVIAWDNGVTRTFVTRVRERYELPRRNKQRTPNKQRRCSQQESRHETSS